MGLAALPLVNGVVEVFCVLTNFSLLFAFDCIFEKQPFNWELNSRLLGRSVTYTVRYMIRTLGIGTDVVYIYPILYVCTCLARNVRFSPHQWMNFAASTHRRRDRFRTESKINSPLSNRSCMLAGDSVRSPAAGQWLAGEWGSFVVSIQSSLVDYSTARWLEPWSPQVRSAAETPVIRMSCRPIVDEPVRHHQQDWGLRVIVSQ